MSKKRSKKYNPYCFLSYSTNEPHLKFLVECLQFVFTPHFEVKLTPTPLASGASQLTQITSLIKNCAFAVVALDGLRPNVLFEYGIIHGMDRPVILLREGGATVDISSYFGDPAGLGLGPVSLKINEQFSDVKDVYYATWNRFEFGKTVKLIWDEYRKKQDDIKDFVEIEEPKLCI